MSGKHGIRESRMDTFFNIVNLTFALIVFLAVLYPIVFVVSASFSSGTALAQGRVWLFPVDINFRGYTVIFKTDSIVRGYLNSAIYMVVGTTFNLIMTVLAAYPLSRKDFYGRNTIMFLFLFTMMFSGGMIPSYLLVKDLHMLDTIWALVVPGALSVWNVTITMNYFRNSLPADMLEAAQIDGCGDTMFMIKIAVPLSKSVLAVMALFYAVGHWNSYFNAMIYLNSSSKFPLQLVLRDILVQNRMDSFSSSMSFETMMERQSLQNLLKYSLIVVSTVPMMILYPFVQKYFVKGVMIGSLKG